MGSANLKLRAEYDRLKLDSLDIERIPASVNAAVSKLFNAQGSLPPIHSGSVNSSAAIAQIVNVFVLDKGNPVEGKDSRLSLWGSKGRTWLRPIGGPGGDGHRKSNNDYICGSSRRDAIRR
jgi:hypothetical protein